MFKKILLSDIDIDGSHKDYRRLIMINLGYLINIFVLALFAFSNIFVQDKLLPGVIEVLFIIPTLYGFFKLRSTKDIEKNSIFIATLFFILAVGINFYFQFKECVSAWALLFPFVIMSLLGFQKALKVVIVFNLIIYIGSYYFVSEGGMSYLAYTRFVTVSIIISSLVYFYEKSISISFEKQEQLNTSLIASIEEARELAITDALTGLYNKRHFDTILSEEFNRAKRADEPFILAIVDIDNFKPYNDTYGHDSGNNALEIVGKILNRQTSRSGDYAFRIGGEEFAVILQSRSSENVDNHFNDLRSKIEDKKIEHMNNKPYNLLTVSIGAVSVVNYEGLTVMDAYREADKNLYAMKHNGRNAVLVSKV